MVLRHEGCAHVYKMWFTLQSEDLPCGSNPFSQEIEDANRAAADVQHALPASNAESLE
jgi:hypothetical protein